MNPTNSNVAHEDLESVAKTVDTRVWLGVLAIVSLARLGVAAAHPLFETECYYWLWSRYPALGYFDHPPMLAYFVRLTDFWGPPHPLAARLHAVVANLAASLALYFLAKNLFNSTRCAVRTVILFNLIPYFSLMAIQCEPDAPLIVFWALTLAAFERALATGKKRWWFLCGLAAGGALLSKLHAFFLLGCLLFYLAISPRDRKRLLSPWPYLAGIVALLVYSPNIYWNATHDWINYAFQLSKRFQKGDFKAVHVVATLAAPLLYLTPWLYIVAIRGAARATRRGLMGDSRKFLLPLCASLPLFLFFVAISFTKLVKIHWPAISFMALLPVVAAEMEYWPKRKRAALYISIAAVTLLMHAWLLNPYFFNRKTTDSWLPDVLRMDDSEEFEEDYSCRRYGWPELGVYLRAELERDDPLAPKLIVSRRFDRAAAAGFFSLHPEAAFVPDVAEADPRAFLYHKVKDAKIGANAIIVLRSPSEKNQRRVGKTTSEAFESVGEPQKSEVKRNGHTVREWMIIPCYGLKTSETNPPRRRTVISDN